MKTSNIILLSIFASIIIGITALYFVGKYESSNYLGFKSKNGGSGNESITKIDLKPFNTIIVSGSGELKILQAEDNYIEGGTKNVVHQQSDTLQVEVNNKCELTFSQISNIIAKGNVRITAEKINANTISIVTSGNSKFKAEILETQSISVNTLGNSGVRLYDINNNGKTIKAQFYLSDNSRLKINENNSLQMQISKSGNASFKVN